MQEFATRIYKLTLIYINEQLYADYLLLIASSKEELKNKTTTWTEVLRKNNLKINMQKTIICMGREK